MGDWSDPVVIVGMAQVLMALILAFFSLLLWKSTSEYAEQVKDQTGYMKENMKLIENQVEVDARINRYNRLRDEMDKLLAPLYFAALTADVSREKWGFFRLVNPINRWDDQEYHDLFAFWDEIKKNLHLCRSEKLSKLLMNHFLYNDDYYTNGQTKEAKKNFEKNLKKLIDEINLRSYPQLQKQIENSEKELDILRDSH